MLLAITQPTRGTEMQVTSKTSVRVLAALLGGAVLAQPAFADVTGNIGVVSKYILRGITQTYNPTYDKSGPEQDGPAVQGGLDYNHESGFYAGYWFSTLGYSYNALNSGAPDTSGKQNSTENDFYAGYNGKVNDKLGYTVGATYYVYSPGFHSSAPETKLGFSYGPVSVTAQTLLNDVTFGNKGDTYWLGTYTHALPQDFTATASLAWYTYHKNGRDINNYGCPDGQYNIGTSCSDAKAVSHAFRHFTVGVTKPIGKTGATWGLQYIFGGKNRFDVSQDDQLVGSLGMAF